MKFFIRLFKTILSWLFPKRLDFVFEFAEDIPKDMESKIISIISEEELEWMIVFQCPCGCNEIIKLNLLKKARPNWTYSTSANKITIWPSIDRVRGCRSHFYITDGMVYWCKLKTL